MKKAFNIIFVILAACIIAAPMIFINREPDKISARENRYLTNFPTADISDPEFRSQFTGWLNDNIGFRDEFLDMRTSILFDGLNVVTSPKVHRGIDGWYFYTLDNNLELSTGEYPLSDEDIDDILKQQLAIRDKLAERGTEYVLVLPASKATIYPEYVGYSDGEIVSIFETGHAVCILTDGGAELLIHVGIDTVKMNGNGFTKKVSDGAKVHAGDVLIEADLNAIKEAGHPATTMMILTNTDLYDSVECAVPGTVTVKSSVMKLTK